MENIKHQFDEINVCGVLFITKRIVDEVEMSEYLTEISSYVRVLDYLYIYNFTNQDLSEFYQALSKYENISYTELSDYGQVANYQIALEQLSDSNCDFGVVLEQGYYYEEGAFLALRRYATENETSNIAVISPFPLRGCEEFSRAPEDTREVMGCNLVGTLINLKLFNAQKGFKLDYYQSMFDYEYCLRSRHNGYKVILLQNEVLRNCNYKILEKKFFFQKLSTFDYDLMDLYYQTRNRFYLWEEYKGIDPKYVKLDKKLYRGERHELKMRDSNFRDKFYMMDEAKFDFLKNKKGKYLGGNENEN